MQFRPTVFALAVILLFSAASGSAQTLRYGNQGDLKSLDPYTLNEVTTLAHLGHVYEGLVARDKNLNIVPALAESWETPEPTRWRFHLRRGVKFHNGDDFTADDVVFSANRVRAKGSNMQTRMPVDAKVMKVDDYTVDFVLSSPIPFWWPSGRPGTSWAKSGPKRTILRSRHRPRLRRQPMPRCIQMGLVLSS